MEYLNKLFNLQDKVVLLTGGGGILAGEMAKGFLSAGCKVVLLDINEENLNKKVEELKKHGSEIVGFKCNVLDEESLTNVKDKIIENFDRIDILVNAAGGNMKGATIGLDQTIFDLHMDDLDKVTNLNFKGTVLPTLVFGKVMTENKVGSVINISSMATFRSITRVVGYSAAKAAVDNFTKWMAVELASKFGSGIRVNAIAPGFLLTDQNRSLLTEEDGSLTQRGKDIIHMTPFKRFGEPEELIGSVLWLAGDASKFVTGTIIPIDGGFSIFSGV
ncbi:MAG: SDR family oxidoreductase [Ignavibacteriae bacterium]|nr:SDR family oxidoreductase [Ignavibacteriota bacterium]MCB0752581.1 SDR family oxidoreductase [Ignavibacteriota bacterium]